MLSAVWQLPTPLSTMKLGKGLFLWICTESVLQQQPQCYFNHEALKTTSEQKFRTDFPKIHPYFPKTCTMIEVIQLKAKVSSSDCWSLACYQVERPNYRARYCKLSSLICWLVRLLNMGFGKPRKILLG